MYIFRIRLTSSSFSPVGTPIAQYGQSEDWLPLLLISGMSSICNEMTGLWFISTRYSSTSMHAQSIASHRIPKAFIPFGKRRSGGRVLHRVLIYNTKPIE